MYERISRYSSSVPWVDDFSCFECDDTFKSFEGETDEERFNASADCPFCDTKMTIEIDYSDRDEDADYKSRREQFFI